MDKDDKKLEEVVPRPEHLVRIEMQREIDRLREKLEDERFNSLDTSIRIISKSRPAAPATPAPPEPK